MLTLDRSDGKIALVTDDADAELSILQDAFGPPDEHPVAGRFDSAPYEDGELRLELLDRDEVSWAADALAGTEFYDVTAELAGLARGEDDDG